MGNVIPLGGVTKLKLPVDTVLDGAKGELEDVIIIGWNKIGELHFASTHSDSTEILWLLEQAKLILLESSRE